LIILQSKEIVCGRTRKVLRLGCPGNCLAIVPRRTRLALPGGGSRVTYATEITGPQAADFGPSDFPDVLAGLKRAAEGV